MSKLSYGLNITKKPPSLANRPSSTKRKTIFDDESGLEDGPDDEDDGAEGIFATGGSNSSRSTSKTVGSSGLARSTSNKPGSKVSQYGDLSTNHTTNKHAVTAQDLDPTIYDYDAVYDSLHAKPQKTAESADKRPKYMSNLIAAAEVRKRDQLRAKEKMLAKEREAEGDEYADKEKFVTKAYLKQQEEMKRLEAEEQQREAEEAERRRRMGGGISVLYKELLERDEKKHAEAVKAAEEAKARGSTTTPAEEKGKSEKSEAELAKEKGALVNDEGQIVDKRQLLGAGLNATPNSTRKSTASSTDAPHSRSGTSRSGGSQGRGQAKQATRQGESQSLEEQLLQASRYAFDDDDEEEVERPPKSRKLA